VLITSSRQLQVSCLRSN